MSGHTPGPWSICLGSGCNVMTGVSKFWDDGHVTVIADCLPNYAFIDDRAPNDHRPNMHLIAAAPELLEALKGMVGLIQLIQSREPALVTNHRFIAAEEAIAKAEGRS